MNKRKINRESCISTATHPHIPDKHSICSWISSSFNLCHELFIVWKVKILLYTLHLSILKSDNIERLLAKVIYYKNRSTKSYKEKTKFYPFQMAANEIEFATQPKKRELNWCYLTSETKKNAQKSANRFDVDCDQIFGICGLFGKKLSRIS